MAETKFGFSLAGIATELDTRRLAVPIYQRPYAWGGDGDRDQVTEFWGDLRSTFTTGNAEYFLGTMVLAKEGVPDRVAIIDGQQRLATTAILIAAIRDEFRARGDNERANIVQTTYLAKADLRTAEQIPQLVLNPEDDTYFRRRILYSEVDAPQTKSSHQLIERAYTTLRTVVAATASDAGADWSARLLDWIDYLRDRVRVIVVEVPTEADAFLIFETLNDRGADLTIADLLKNYLFGTSSDRLDIVRNCWIGALTNLDTPMAGSQVFTDFLRHYWSSRYGATRERELYARIKGRVTTAASAVQFAERLQDASRLYAAILNSDHEVWSHLGRTTRRQLDVLSTLNLGQNRPLILAALEHLEPIEVAKLLSSMISWGIRGIIGGVIGGGSAERVYCDAAVRIRDGKITTATQIGTELANIIPADDQFREAFAVARITRGSLARYMLVALERTRLGEREPELVPNEDEAQVNLEHILPRNPSPPDWPGFSEEQRRAYVNRLGNLALLAKGPNDRIGNKPFHAKKPILLQSRLLLTKAAGQESEWTPETIARRQERLADLALKTWPV